jgi:hypothetical protein
MNLLFPLKKKKDWISLINESVNTYDDIDIGDVYAVSRNFIVIKRGFVNVHYYYYIPIKKVEGWDGNVLWLKVTEEEVKEKYERDIIPDPNNYFIKDYPYYTGFNSYNPTLPVIARRYPEPINMFQNYHLRKMFLQHTDVVCVKRSSIRKMN